LFRRHRARLNVEISAAPEFSAMRGEARNDAAPPLRPAGRSGDIGL